MKAFLFFITLSPLLYITQENSKDWPKHQRKGFMESCIMNAKSAMTKKKAKIYCDCMLEKLIVKYPNHRDATKMTKEEVSIMAKECI